MAESVRRALILDFLLRRPWSASILAGLLLAAALPPYHVLPGVIGLAVPAVLLRHEPSHLRALACVFVFGWVFALASLWWVGIAFHSHPTRFAAGLAVPAVLALAAAYAATLVAVLALGRLARALPPALFAFSVAGAWVWGELLRAGPLFRFPWNPLAAVWGFSDLALAAIAWVGVSGLSLLTAFAAVLVGLLVRETGGFRPGLAFLSVGALLTVPAFGAWHQRTVDASGVTDTRVRLVQANIPQHHKWDPGRMEEWFRRHLTLTASPAPDGLPALVVWPESAVPYDVEGNADAMALIAAALPPGAYVAFGADRYLEDNGRVFLNNSLYLLSPQAQILDRYDKVDLVPFGEFLPFRRILRRLGLRALTASLIDYTPGPARRTLVADGLPPFSPLICYEAAFPGRATDGSGRAQLLVAITNDGWFGDSPGPYQHFTMARMRAIETGLPLVRAANTGISAIVDGLGQVRAFLPLGATGVIDGPLPPPLSAPPIARWPALPAGVAIVLAILCVMVDYGRAGPNRWARRLGLATSADAMQDRRQ